MQACMVVFCQLAGARTAPANPIPRADWKKRQSIASYPPTICIAYTEIVFANHVSQDGVVSAEWQC